MRTNIIYGCLMIFFAIVIVFVSTIIVYNAHLPNIAIMSIQLLVGLICALIICLGYSLIFNVKVIIKKRILFDDAYLYLESKNWNRNGDEK